MKQNFIHDNLQNAGFIGKGAVMRVAIVGSRSIEYDRLKDKAYSRQCDGNRERRRRRNRHARGNLCEKQSSADQNFQAGLCQIRQKSADSAQRRNRCICTVRAGVLGRKLPRHRLYRRHLYQGRRTGQNHHHIKAEKTYILQKILDILQ